jgi:alpha-methylacyl-CoA racemase
VSPVLTLGEAPSHPHLRARGTVAEVDGIAQPAPAPRFSRTPGSLTTPKRSPGQDTREVLRDWGLPADEVSALEQAGVVVQG